MGLLGIVICLSAFYGEPQMTDLTKNVTEPILLVKCKTGLLTLH